MADLSVVIPTFRRPVLVLEAIRSALGNSAGVDVEVIVIDDSPEESAQQAVAGLADSRVRYVANRPVSGGKPALVRNAGFALTTSPLVHFLDDDDRVADGFYRSAIQAFATHADIGVVFGRIDAFGDGDAESMAHEHRFFADAARRARLAKRLGLRSWMVANLLFAPTVLVNSACVVRRECVEQVGGYDAELRLNEDVEFYLRAIRHSGFAFLDQTVLHYRILGASLMHGRSDDAMLVDTYRRMHAKYRATNGNAEFLALKILARTLMRFL